MLNMSICDNVELKTIIIINQNRTQEFIKTIPLFATFFCPGTNSIFKSIF